MVPQLFESPMKKTNKPFTAIFILAIGFLATVSFTNPDDRTKPDSPNSGLLYSEIAHMDSLLFDGFNSRNVDKMKVFFDPSLELYQDNIGVRNYKETVEAFSKLFKQDNILTRKLVPGSMEVYPIKGYGAIQTGMHTFSHIENGKPVAATFKFMNIWHKKGNDWKITRLVTYDHPEDWK